VEHLFVAIASHSQLQFWQCFGLLSLVVVITAARRQRRLAQAAAPVRVARRGLGLLTLALVLGLALGGTILPLAGASVAAAQATPAPMDAVDVVKQVGPAVATIVTTNKESRGILPDTEEVGSGSGFFIDEQGHVVTNNHVVEGGDEFEVIFADGTTQAATLVGRDPITDVAVLQVPGPVPAVVALGDSDAVQVGQPVLAIGSPLGTFTNTVTQGIVSALGRSLAEDPNNPGLHLTGLIQHDAAINPGNSGGPLVNQAGEVIGINTLAVTQVDLGVSAQGLFFAVPSNTVQRVSTELIATGQVVYPFLGISDSVELTPRLAGFLHLSVDHGVYVGDVVNDGPADQAGMEGGDVIVAINGTELGEQNSLTDILYTYKPGDVVQMDIVRGDAQQTLSVTLGSRPSS
jgi:2-alkenal reductase